jgi:hypothetical protein
VDVRGGYFGVEGEFTEIDAFASMLTVCLGRIMREGGRRNVPIFDE